VVKRNAVREPKHTTPVYAITIAINLDKCLQCPRELKVSADAASPAPVSPNCMDGAASPAPVSVSCIDDAAMGTCRAV
jgi:hypothetical protein